MAIKVKPNRNIRKQILLDDETATKLKFLSLTNYISENEIINRALHAYLARSKFPTLEEMKNADGTNEEGSDE
jgi:hypothetical protein